MYVFKTYSKINIELVFEGIGYSLREFLCLHNFSTFNINLGSSHAYEGHIAVQIEKCISTMNKKSHFIFIDLDPA